MNIQIFGRARCFDTKKAQRFFKERRVPFQFIDLAQKPMSRGELLRVAQAVGGWEALLDERQPDAALVRYLADDAARLEKLLVMQELLRTPVVRNGRQATVGEAAEVWKRWTQEGQKV